MVYHTSHTISEGVFPTLMLISTFKAPTRLQQTTYLCHFSSFWGQIRFEIFLIGRESKKYPILFTPKKATFFPQNFCYKHRSRFTNKECNIFLLDGDMNGFQDPWRRASFGPMVMIWTKFSSGPLLDATYQIGLSDKMILNMFPI